MAKVKNQAPKNDNSAAEDFSENTPNNNFDFSDNSEVTLIGTGKQGFVMSPKKEYKVGGKLAKILIKKGAAKLK